MLRGHFDFQPSLLHQSSQNLGPRSFLGRWIHFRCQIKNWSQLLENEEFVCDVVPRFSIPKKTFLHFLRIFFLLRNTVCQIWIKNVHSDPNLFIYKRKFPQGTPKIFLENVGTKSHGFIYYNLNNRISINNKCIYIFNEKC